MMDLFSEAPPLPPEDQRLVHLYERTGRTLDALPYTAAFEEIYSAAQAQGDDRDRRAIFHRLHNLRKAGRLPRLGRIDTSVPIEAESLDVLRELVLDATGSLGHRDQLPYTPEFDQLVERFNAVMRRPMDPASVWRLIARIAK